MRSDSGTSKVGKIETATCGSTGPTSNRAASTTSTSTSPMATTSARTISARSCITVRRHSVATGSQRSSAGRPANRPARRVERGRYCGRARPLPAVRAPVVGRCAVHGNSGANATQRWFTHSWPFHWFVVWTVVPTAPAIDGAAQIEWKVQITRQAETLLKINFIEIKNLQDYPVTVQARVQRARLGSPVQIAREESRVRLAAEGHAREVKHMRIVIEHDTVNTTSTSSSGSARRDRGAKWRTRSQPCRCKRPTRRGKRRWATSMAVGCSEAGDGERRLRSGCDDRRARWRSRVRINQREERDHDIRSAVPGLGASGPDPSVVHAQLECCKQCSVDHRTDRARSGRKCATRVESAVYSSGANLIDGFSK